MTASDGSGHHGSGHDSDHGHSSEIERSSFRDKANAMLSLVTGPATWFREKVVEPGRPDYPWYHRRYRRVPTIDQCYMTDMVCRSEANSQWKRDKAVEENILLILRRRWEDCIMWNHPNHKSDDPSTPCYEIKNTYDTCALNYYIKYGDLAWWTGAEQAFMKQKHRMIWERRHGEVGSGMKNVTKVEG